MDGDAENAETAVASATATARFTVGTDGSRTRELVSPIQGHPTPENPTGKIDRIVLRKPKYRDVMRNGDPETLVVVDGGYVPQTDMAIIERYIAALSQIDTALLEQIDYRDALALRDAVKDFFR